MSEYEVKTDEKRFTLESADALVASVRSGQLGRATLVREAGTKPWVRADTVPSVAALFSDDVWSAWEGDADESLLDAFQEPEPAARPTPQFDPMPTMPPVDEVEELPAAAMAPVDAPVKQEAAENSAFSGGISRAETTHPSGPPRRPPAKVIAFPNLDAQTMGSSALKSAPRPFESAPKSMIRWRGIVLLAGVGGVAMMMWVWFVNMHATADFAPAQRTAQTAAAIPPPLAADEIAAEISPYDTLEDELREQLMEGILDIPGETDFEDALLIELRRVRVDVRSVRVSIASWAGRRQDLPDEVSFNLKVMARDGELDRDLGALGLVMGKYIQHYGLQVTELNVILSAEDGLRKVTMNPETARRYFTHRVSLERFLKAAFAGVE
jgi:hypothetical protein